MLGSLSSGYEQRCPEGCPEDELEGKLGPKHQTPAGDELGTAPSLVKGCMLQLKCREAASNCNTHRILSEKASFPLNLFEKKRQNHAVPLGIHRWPVQRPEHCCRELSAWHRSVSR